MVGEIKKPIVKEELKFFSGFGVADNICCLDNQGRVWRRAVAADNDFGKWMLIENPQIEQLKSQERTLETETVILDLKNELQLRMDRISNLETVSKNILKENHDLKVQLAEAQKKLADSVMKDM